MAGLPRRRTIELGPTCSVCGKVMYPTKQKAYKAAKMLQGPNGRALMAVYKCKMCKAYHLTHTKNMQRK